jgi:hypothetical protein
LGTHIFLRENSSDRILWHEMGHSKQSRILGPLYLLAVGLPSVTVNLVARIFKKNAAWYYSQYPEKWADELGGIER